VITLVRERTPYVIRGNHDNALAHNVDCQCSTAFKPLSVSTRDYHRTLLGRDEIDYLKTLPLTQNHRFGETTFHLVHAAPSDPLFKYLKPSTPMRIWQEEVKRVDADVILLGHSHLPFLQKIKGRWVINPGSVGQPRDHNPMACFALWEDGKASLRRVAYPVEKTIGKLDRSPLPKGIVQKLSSILRNGGA
jgi:putative phosphoesterase